MKRIYYEKIDLIRVFSCIAILLYHLGILKGGYLAVCTFFVLSGYLSVVSFSKKDTFSLKKYYLHKFIKIYLPLIIVVFITISIISFIPSINWLNLKPETTSVLLGYNNFWQLNANLDYFVRHISSPFMHLWYISILLQFELVFPFIYILFRRIGEKCSKIIPIILFGILGISSYLLFYKTVNDGNIMVAYYGTITRLFSILFGLCLGFIHYYYRPLGFKNKIMSKIMFLIYFLALMAMFYFIDVKSSFFNLGMIISTFISLRLIDYGVIDIGKKHLPISSLSKISYEIYLIQYPVIFLFQNIHINFFMKTFSIITITLILSFIIHYALNIKKHDHLIILKIMMIIIILPITIYGIIQYIHTKDYTKDMKKLEEDLNQNRLMIEEKQKQYQEKYQNDQDEWEKVLNDFESSEQNLKEMVRNLRIVGIGDSIMELAVKDLYKEFPNGYFDAAVNRTEHQANDILVDLKNKNLLGDIIVFNLGTNGECSVKCKDQIMNTIGNRKVFWLNATHPDYPTFNPNLEKLAERYENIHIIDWVSVAKEHPEYIISDKVHPTVTGCRVYAKTIYDAIYQEYLNEFNKQKEAKIKEHEQKEMKKITFIGNDLLLGLYEHLKEDYNDSEFIIDKDFTYSSFKKQIEEKIKGNSMSHNMVLLFDQSFKMSDDELSKIIKICTKNNIYIVDLYHNININEDNVHIIKFYKELKNNRNYIAPDRVHLTNDGNIALKEIIKENLKINE